MKFVATKKGMTTNFFHPSLLLLFLDPGPEIRDPGWVKIRIWDKNPESATLLIFTEFRPIPYFGYKDVLCDDRQDFVAWSSISRLEGSFFVNIKKSFQDPK